MNLIMEEKSSPPQYHTIYHELTGVKPLSVNHFLIERMEMVVQVPNANVIRDLHIHYQRERSLIYYENLLSKNQTNDHCRHSETTRNGHTVAHLALAVSVRDLY